MPASDYFIDIGDPFAKSMAAFRGAYGDVERLRQFGEARQERQRVAQERQSGMDALQNLVRLGNNATSGDYMSALAANPAFGQQIGAMQKTFGAERSANELRFAQQLFNVLAGDDIDLSRQMLDEREAAYRNAGDNRAADSARALRLMLDKPGGIGAARSSVGMMLAAGMGGPEFKAFFEQFYPQQKEIAGASPIGKLYQDFRAGLIPQSVFDTAVRLETKEKEEGLTLQQKIGEEARLRGEYNKRAQSLSDAETSFSNLEIAANQNTGPGDIALITSFMKMLDPGSVVREGEFQTAEQSSGLFNKLTNLLEKAQTGSRLSPKQRNDFVDLARKYLEASRKKEAQVRAGYGLIVDNYKLNPVNVFGAAAVPSVTAPAPTASPAVPPGAAAAPTPSTPSQSFLNDQKIRQIANSRGLTIEQIWQQLPAEMRERYAGN